MANSSANWAESEEFADIMCLGDGTGPAKPQTWNEERAAALARCPSLAALSPLPGLVEYAKRLNNPLTLSSLLSVITL